MKIASFCVWLEKRIELGQSTEYFLTESGFNNHLWAFHKLEEYIRPDSFISYESDYMMFSYQRASKKFSFAWKKGRWDYRRSKISYIPSERNMVAAIPNRFEVTLPQNNIRNFMADWEFARRNSKASSDILNLGITYHYDSLSRQDLIQIAADTSLNFTNTSSGLQSLVPMFVVLSYIYSSVYKDEKGMRLSDSAENESLLRLIYQELFVKKNRTDGKVQTFRGIGDIKLRFDDDKAADECEAIYKRYVKTDHCDIFLEEPENNLFPPTQKDVAKWLIESTLREHENTLSITTHSPYMLGAFLEDNIELGLFYCLKRDEGVIIHTATEEELQTIYSGGIDAFFNLENLSELN